MEWPSDAACRDVDPELFFPVGPIGPALVQAHRAKSVCRRCPVIQECAEFALGNREITGIWGGMDDEERRAERAARRRAPAVAAVRRC
jgi:WhiB family redox-sensing transcriptional regulator